MKCAVCVYVRNEARDIQEWIAYHKAIGFDAFLIYDNGSTDATLERIAQMQALADIRVVDWSGHIGEGAQNACYTDCCARFGAEFDWIAFIDSDEYLSSPTQERIQSLLARNAHAVAIALNWAMFGSNGHQDFPTGLLIEAFDRRADATDEGFVTYDACRHVKMIIRPGKMVRYRNPHCFDMLGWVVTHERETVTWESPGIAMRCNLDGWRVNHYFTRSRAHWAAKMARGYRDITRTDHEFTLYDRNEVRDRSAAAWAGPVLRLLDVVRSAPTNI